jgi:iron complex outermembrane receptor protein/outer membrane receptor for ferric coprogen and ferric-rhodotorulic acid
MARPSFPLYSTVPLHAPARHALALAARCAVLAMACTAGSGQAQTMATAAAQSEATRHYQIASGALDEALADFAAQAGVSISMSPALVQGRTSPGLQGRHSVQAGFSRLLAGSGLEAVAGSGGVYTLRALPVVTPGTAAGQGATLGEVKVTAEAVPGGATEGTGRYTTQSSTSATRLGLDVQKTPQSITVITRQQMDDQGLQGVADVLRQTPGIAVNRDNTEGYSFYARGFQVENFQFDGVPSLSSAGGNVRDNYSLTDSAIYDRVEILKGATGLVNGVGDPSGVINLVRKRPTADFQGHASVDVGSWNDYRGEVDVSSPLTADGRIRGRLVAAAQDSHSFIDYLKTRKSLLYGIVEADLAASTTLSLGFNLQQNKGQGTTNSHLPAFFSDGTVARFARSTNAADRWARRDQDTQHLFATLEHELGKGWNLKAHLGQRKYQSREVISGISSATIDASTHSVDHGFYAGGASQFNTDTTEDSVDLQLSGKYALGGREHKLVLGYGAARTKAVSDRFDGDTDALIPDVFHWDNNASQPTAYEWWSRFDVNARQKIAYAATVLQPSDKLSVILGGRVTDYSWSLASINALGRSSYASTKIHGKFIPYAGITFDVDDRHTLYASYTDVFKPQAYNYDAHDRQLDPLTGKSYELGIKGSYLNDKLHASAAVFQLQQDNYAINDPSGATRPDGGVASVAIQGVTTKGVELEVFGELLPGWQLGAGITAIQPRDAHGRRVSANQPEKSFKLATMYRLPGAWKHVSVGGNAQWQSATYFTQQIAGVDRRFGQAAYTVVGLVAGVQLNRQLKATFSIDNLFDKYYYAGIGNYNSVFWGAPRSFKANLRYIF